MSAIVALLPDGRLHLQHGPIDCLCQAWGDPAERRAAYNQAAACFPQILTDLCAELPLLRKPLPSQRPNGTIARAMHAACLPHADRFITPMAAVAGAVADAVLAAMVRGRHLSRAFVNNGGDIAFHLQPGTTLRCGLITNIETSRVTPSPPHTVMPVSSNTVMAGHPNSVAPGQPNSITPGQPNSITPGQPNSITPGQPNSVTPGQPTSITPGHPNSVMAGLVPATHDFASRQPHQSWVAGPSPAMTQKNNWSRPTAGTTPPLDGTFLLTSTATARGIATSGRACKGRGGRSFSFGIADSVSVLARTAAQADAAATIIANAVNLPNHPAIHRRPASEIDPASDLRDRLITFDVGELSESAIKSALDAGVMVADTLRQDGLIEGAVLALRGHLRVRHPSLALQEVA